MRNKSSHATLKTCNLSVASLEVNTTGWVLHSN